MTSGVVSSSGNGMLSAIFRIRRCAIPQLGTRPAARPLSFLTQKSVFFLRTDASETADWKLKDVPPAPAPGPPP